MVHVTGCVPEGANVAAGQQVCDTPGWLPWNAEHEAGRGDTGHLDQRVVGTFEMFEDFEGADAVERTVFER